MTGTPFGRYRLQRLLARGGMAEVYLATLTGAAGFEKKLAVKKILPMYADLEEFTDLFRDEARICAALDHGNIVQVFDYGEVDGQHFIAMEYVDGPDLEKVLAASRKLRQPLSTEAVLYIGIRIASALDFAHRHTDGQGRSLHLVHRDVSPGNVLISATGDVKITDFGVARVSRSGRGSQSGVVRGKYAYMSPEQVQGQALDLRSDVFSMGTVIYEMLTGLNPFQGGSDFHSMEAIVQGRLRPVQEVRPDVPRDLARLVARCLEVPVARRFASAEEARQELSTVLWNQGVMDDPALLLSDLVRLFPRQLQRRGLTGRTSPLTPAGGMPIPRPAAALPKARPRLLGPSDGQDTDDEEDDLTVPHVGNPDAIPTQPVGPDDVDDQPKRSISDPFLPNAPRIRKDGVRLPVEPVSTPDVSGAGASGGSGDDWAQISLLGLRAGASSEGGAADSHALLPDLSSASTPPSPFRPIGFSAPEGPPAAPPVPALASEEPAPAESQVPRGIGLGAVSDVEDADMNPPSAISLVAVRMEYLLRARADAAEAAPPAGSPAGEPAAPGAGPVAPADGGVAEDGISLSLASVADAAGPVDESARTVQDGAQQAQGPRSGGATPEPGGPEGLLVDEQRRTVHAPTLSARVDEQRKTVHAPTLSTRADEGARTMAEGPVPPSPSPSTGPPPDPDPIPKADKALSPLPLLGAAAGLRDAPPEAVSAVHAATIEAPPVAPQAASGQDAASEPEVGPTRSMIPSPAAGEVSGVVPLPSLGPPPGSAPASPAVPGAGTRKKKKRKKEKAAPFPWLSVGAAALALGLMAFVLRRSEPEPAPAVVAPKVRVTPPKGTPVPAPPPPSPGMSPPAAGERGAPAPPESPATEAPSPPPAPPSTAAPPVKLASASTPAAVPSPAPPAAGTPAPRPPKPEPTPAPAPKKPEPTPAPVAASASDAPVKVPPGSVQVTVRSDPTGASLIIAGRGVGKAPWIGRGKPGDLLEVTAKLEGYHPTTRLLKVGQENLDATVLLTNTKTDAGEGSVYITSEPWAYVYLDGKVTGKVTPIRLTLSAGSHEVILENPDAGWSARRTITIEAGGDQDLRLSQ